MMCRRRIISGIIGALVFVGVVCADMVPVGELGARRQQSVCVSGGMEVQQPDLSGLYESPIAIDSDLRAVQFPPRVGLDIGQPSQVSHSINLTGGQGSVSLCLCALMGLCLCSAPHWVKRLSLGHIPEWYHDGGPFQIGHSLAVSPESLCPVPVYCFVQPVRLVELVMSQCRLRTIASLWRESQFTLCVLASRGPPLS